MIISGHIINDSEIVGIGPLMLHSRATSQMQETMYAPKYLLFSVHLKTRSLEIESAVYSTKGLTDAGVEYKSKTEYAFKKIFIESRRNIAEMLFKNSPKKLEEAIVEIELEKINLLPNIKSAQA
jgi:hypothetical protein